MPQTSRENQQGKIPKHMQNATQGKSDVKNERAAKSNQI